MAREREYCYKAVLNESYVLFLGRPFGSLWHVFVANRNLKEKDLEDFENIINDPDYHTYSVYGGYKNIGTASNRLLESAMTYKSNPVKYYYTTKENIIKYGAFGVPELN